MIRLRTVGDFWLRRLTALLAAACFLIAPVEAFAVPDVHDGDVPAANHGAGSESTLDDSTPDLNSDNGPRNEAPASDHTTHVDHCAHGHSAATASAQAPGVPLDWHISGAIGDLASLHESVVLSPRQRPPII